MLHRINLMDWQQRQAISRLKRFLGLILLSIFFFGGIQALQWRALSRAQAATVHQQKILADKKAEIKGKLTQWQHSQTDFKQNQQRLAQMKHWLAVTAIPYRIMTLVQESVTQGVYLHSLNLSGRQVTVRGYGAGAGDVSQFLERLRAQSCQCVTNLKMEAVKQADDSPERVQTFRLSFVFSTDEERQE